MTARPSVGCKCMHPLEESCPRGYRVALYMSLQDFARAQPAFLTQNLHQPAGLISPSTSVQAFGSWNREQLLHC
jgi:hypothetical protein